MYLFSLITVLAIFGIFHMYVQGNLRVIQAEWSSYRCNPAYVFVPAMIDVGVDVNTNFQSCLNVLGGSVVGQMNDGLNSQFSLIGGMLADMVNPLNIFRQMINAMRGFIASFTSSTLGKASGPVSMFVFYLNKIQDLIRRMVGEGYIAAFFGLSVVGFIEGFVSLVFNVIKLFVRAMLIIAIILSLFNLPLLAFVLSLASALYVAGA
jgi:hypothetical protein